MEIEILQNITEEIPLFIPVRYGLCDNGNGIVTAAAPPFLSDYLNFKIMCYEKMELEF